MGKKTKNKINENIKKILNQSSIDNLKTKQVIANALICAKEKTEYSWENLAELTGVSRATIYRYINNTIDDVPDMHFMVRFCACTKTSIEELVDLKKILKYLSHQ